MPAPGPPIATATPRRWRATTTLKDLAKGLAAEGVASLRYDKRGIGESRAGGARESDLRFDTYVDDAAGWIIEIERRRAVLEVIVAGHSEGSLIGMLAATKPGRWVRVDCRCGAPGTDVLRSAAAAAWLDADDVGASGRMLMALKQVNGGGSAADLIQALPVLRRSSGRGFSPT